MTQVWRKKVRPLISSRWFGLILLLLHLPVLLVLVMKTEPWLTGDSLRYLALAESLKTGRGFGLENGAVFELEGWRMPGYPAFIAACHALLGPNAISVVIIQSLLFLASVWVAWVVADKTFGRQAGLAFLALSAVYPFVAYNVGQLSPEIPTVFLTALALYCLTQPTMARYAIAGGLLGATGYFRPNLFPLGVAVGVALILANRRHYRGAATLMVAVAVMALPWALRNYLTFGKFSPMPACTAGAGHSLLSATWQARVSSYSLIEYGVKGKATVELESSGMIEQISALNRRLNMPPETVSVTPESYPGNEKKIQAERLFAEAAFENMKAWPLAYLRSTAINVPRLWFSAYFPQNLPFVVRAGFVLFGLLTLLLCIAGMVFAMRNNSNPHQRGVIFAAVGGILYLTASLCWFHTEARYTIPLRLVCLMFAAYGLAQLSGRLYAASPVPAACAPQAAVSGEG